MNKQLVSIMSYRSISFSIDVLAKSSKSYVIMLTYRSASYYVATPYAGKDRNKLGLTQDLKRAESFDLRRDGAALALRKRLLYILRIHNFSYVPVSFAESMVRLD